MSEFFKDLRALDINGDADEGDAREAAVAAALVLINSKVGNSPERGGILQEEMGRLSAYADQIQEALKVK